MFVPHGMKASRQKEISAPILWVTCTNTLKIIEWYTTQ